MWKKCGAVCICICMSVETSAETYVGFSLECLEEASLKISVGSPVETSVFDSSGDMCMWRLLWSAWVNTLINDDKVFIFRITKILNGASF